MSAKAKIGQEPELDLSAFYNGPTDPAIERDMETAANIANSFVAQYKGRIGTLGPDALAACIDDMDAYSSISGRIICYAYILKAKNAEQHGAFFEDLNNRLTDIGNKLVFYGLEMADLDPATLKKAMAKSPVLARYHTYLEGFTRSKPYKLSEGEEQMAQTKDMSGSTAWVNLFDELMPAIKFQYKGKTLNEGEILDIMYSDPDRTVRAEAYKSFVAGLKDNMLVLTHITNALALDKANSDKMRGYPTAITARNLSNNIDDGIVDALNDAVKAAYPRTAHRFYDIKRRYLGLKTLKPYDRNAPMLKTKEDPISWDDARKIVIDGYRAFSPELADIVQMFFDKKWIDARATKGKDGGAFSHPMVVDKHPVVFINWRGTRHDVATLAHELGHAAHQWLAARTQKSDILADTPLTLAETASVFGEKLIFEKLLAEEKDPQQRIAMLAGKIDDMVNTVVRQIAFFNFEKELHAARRSEGRLSSDRIGDIFMKTQAESLGPAVSLDKDYKHLWSYIPHFVHTPFYVYAYAFGECMVNSLYDVYRQETDKPAFVEKYMQLLKDGGSKDQTEAVKPFGLDLRDPQFWDRGMKTLEDMLDRLETEIKAAKKAAPKTGPKPA